MRPLIICYRGPVPAPPARAAELKRWVPSNRSKSSGQILTLGNPGTQH